ncbi:MAG TPA: exodeoxyribonuclease VII small subunit [Polymorphobacter sp.]|nr:exodeoxyribonuclease VII small subunit [Polymorphobacter sp.]
MSDEPDPLANLSFEAALARLEAIVHKLEAGDASLEESIAIYTEGQALKTHCEAKLAGATARIEAIQLGADGAAVATKPFDA